MERYRTDSADETVALGKRLAGRLDVGDLVAVEGELGAGKTVLVRGIALG
ncbi:MAG TPA: tRNA (adenosine(37)-N6)-threonylcarbamoyltransferase complex ATPase subunit type 1 TsaE, partial [Phycisphaerae bacterium]|nr:tRNA (adenosine(37)-N6)-threonylcarbamoyltransferase complex ATPase subunit type 1 TsaE [Phycisphaerae bacterium]